ncbi:MAG: hypothetical protein ACRCUY_10135 [Thermoguttaceae bacterium]
MRFLYFLTILLFVLTFTHSADAQSDPSGRVYLTDGTISTQIGDPIQSGQIQNGQIQNGQIQNGSFQSNDYWGSAYPPGGTSYSGGNANMGNNPAGNSPFQPSNSINSMFSLPVTTLNPQMETGSNDQSTLILSVGNGGTSSKIPGKREGVFQKLSFDALWIAKNGKNGLGMTELDLSAMFAFPLPTRDAPFVITPKFQTWFFDSSENFQFPVNTLYTTGADFRWFVPIVQNKLMIDMAVSTLYSGDFKSSGSKAMRFPAHIAGIWTCNPRLKVVLGAAYFDRMDNYNIMPVGGIIWTPQEDLNFELVFPKLKAAQRVRWFGSRVGDDQSDWIYAAFEWGGGSWTIQEHLSGEKNLMKVDYRDYRTMLGYERRTSFGVNLGLEVGYSFERNFDFEYFGKAKPSDAFFIRFTSSY